MKKLNKFFAILVALAMMATLCVMTAFADEENPTSGTDMYITKTLQIPQGLSTVAERFTFNGDLQSVDGVAIADTTADTALDFSAYVDYAAGETDTDADGYIRKGVNIDLDSINFTHAGVYVYTVKEAIPAQADKTAGMTYDTNEYTVTIRVKNGANGPEVDSVVVEDDGQKKDVDDPGNDPTGDQTGEKAASGANFINTYTKIADDTDTDDPVDPDDPTQGYEKASFVVGKTVTGDYGDKSKQFKYELTINADPAKTYVENPTITVTKDGTAIALDNGKYSFTLADGEEVVVEGAPVGTLYTVKEILATDDEAALKYTPAVEVKEDGEASDKSVAMVTERDAAKEGKDLTVTNALVGDDASYSEFTNRNWNDEQTPTGILMNNLPYIVLALVAIGGLVAYVVVRRRQADEA